MNNQKQTENNPESIVLKTAWIPCLIAVFGLGSWIVVIVLHCLGITK